jgi:xanthine dehydrogenase YagT iron-sulfur-binding subunit
MNDFGRRTFLKSSGAVAAANSVRLKTPVAAQGRESAPRPAPVTAVTVSVNGQQHRIEVEDRWTLVEVLRDHLQLTGTKIGCDRGECGACTVLLDGKPVYACSQLAVWVDGREVDTIEGLARGGQLHSLQEAFIENDGPQCGFCTSGQLMSAKALLDRNSDPTPNDVREALTGNICRCSNYNRYVASVLAAAAKGKDGA